MCRLLLILTLIALFGPINVITWRNYRVNLLSLNIRYVNPELFIVHTAEIKKVNRTHSFLNINTTTLQVGDNATMKVQFYQQVSGRYKESLPRIPFDMCSILSLDLKTEATGFVGRAIRKLKAPILETIRGPGQKFPRSCPISPDNYHIFIRVDENMLPAFFLPAGRWRFDGEMIMNNVTRVLDGYIVFEVVNYSSLKQKQHV